MVSLCTLNTALFHELRYFQPVVPVFLQYVVAGCAAAADLATRPRVRRAALHGLLAVTLAFSLVAVPMWGVRYARAGTAIGSSDVFYASWITHKPPARRNRAVKDVGAVAYLEEHRVVDLLGLGTNGFTKASNNGIGSLYEALRHLPAARRPGHFATYDTGPGPSFAPMRDAGVLEKPAVAVFDVKTPPDLRNILAVSVPPPHDRPRRLEPHRQRRQGAGPGDVRDYLNVAYLGAEEKHGYSYLAAETGMQPWSVLAHRDEVIASRRSIVGGEVFTMRGLTPGRPAVLTARASVRGVPDLPVFVNGRFAGTWTRTPGDGAWQRYSFTIPGHLPTDSTARIMLGQPKPGSSPYPDYASYGYWLSQ